MPEANAALQDELVRRINEIDCLARFREQEAQRGREQERTRARLFFVRHYGVGSIRLGKAQRVYGGFVPRPRGQFFEPQPARNSRTSSPG
jgi:hypothetical protein